MNLFFLGKGRGVTVNRHSFVCKDVVSLNTVFGKVVHVIMGFIDLAIHEIVDTLQIFVLIIKLLEAWTEWKASIAFICWNTQFIDVFFLMIKPH